MLLFLFLDQVKWCVLRVQSLELWGSVKTHVFIPALGKWRAENQESEPGREGWLSR